MTLTSTIRRRAQRARARERRAEYEARLAAMTPEQRAFRRRMLEHIIPEATSLMRRNLSAASLINRHYGAGVGDTINMRRR